MENPMINFLKYLVTECVDKCEIDPDATTVSDFIRVVEEASTPAGF